MYMTKQLYYISATVRTPEQEHKKIVISATDLKAAFDVQRDLYNHKVKQIVNIRMSKAKPKRTKKRQYIEIRAIDEI
jgi:hypothetical protein